MTPMAARAWRRRPGELSRGGCGARLAHPAGAAQVRAARRDAAAAMQAVTSDHAGGRSDEIPAGRSHDVSEHQDAAGSAGSGKLAGLFHEYGHRWEIEHVDPGSAWVAVTRNGSFVQVIAAHDLDELRAELKKAEAEDP
jgi:hypothetical protein